MPREPNFANSQDSSMETPARRITPQPETGSLRFTSGSLGVGLRCINSARLISGAGPWSLDEEGRHSANSAVLNEPIFRTIVCFDVLSNVNS